MHTIRKIVFEKEEKRARKMVNRRFGVIFAFVVALIAQTYSECIDPRVVREILRIVQQDRMDRNMVRDNVDVIHTRMRSMPPEEEDLGRVPPPDARISADNAMDERRMMMMAMRDEQDRMRRSRVRQALMNNRRMRMRSMPPEEEDLGRVPPSDARISEDSAMDERRMMIKAMKDENDRMRSRVRRMRMRSIPVLPPNRIGDRDDLIKPNQPV